MTDRPTDDRPPTTRAAEPAPADEAASGPETSTTPAPVQEAAAPVAMTAAVALSAIPADVEPAGVSSAAGPPPYPPPGGAVPPYPGPSTWGQAAPAPRTPRRTLRAVLRWTSAVLAFAALGAGTAYAVTQPERTEIPGLRTPDDGRWTYPQLALPRLPAGKPGALDDVRNPPGRHYADLRSLLLPAPEGATAIPSLPGRKGWLSQDAFVKLLAKKDRGTESTRLREEACRHIAAGGWTMPDGTRTEIYLLQFESNAYANREQRALADAPPEEMHEPEDDYRAVHGTPDHVAQYLFVETRPYGARGERMAHLVAGDTIAVVTTSRPGGAAEVPFDQTVLLQSQLLG